MIKGFVFKGEFKMSNYNVIYKKSTTINIDTDRYIEKINELFHKNIMIMRAKLESIQHEIWLTDEIEEEAKDIVLKIKENYILEKSLGWKVEVTSILSDILEKLEISFLKVDEMYIDELDRCEELYNLLSCMYPDIEEIIQLKFATSEKNREKNLPTSISNKQSVYNRNKDLFRQINLNINSGQSGYKIAA